MILVALNLESSFNCRFFLNRFPLWHNLFVLVFLVTFCFVVAVLPWRFSWKKKIIPIYFCIKLNLAIVNFWLLIYGKRISYLKSIIAAVDNGYNASKINLLIHNSVEKRLSQQLGSCGFCKIFQNIFLWSTSERTIPMLLGPFLHRLS